MQQCLRAAINVVELYTIELMPFKIFLRHGVEAQSIFVTFAAAFLIKASHTLQCRSTRNVD